MDRHPMISAFVLALVGILAGPASQATAAQGSPWRLLRRWQRATSRVRSILAGGNCIWSAAARAPHGDPGSGRLWAGRRVEP